jgi:predicted ester cyclase
MKGEYPMTAENKAIARHIYEDLWNSGNLNVADEIFVNAEGVKKYIATFRAAFPDIQHTIEDLIAEGDQIMVRFTARGTHQGAWKGIAPTGKQVTYTGMTILQIVNGKVTKHYTEWDALGLMQQIGAVPT